MQPHALVQTCAIDQSLGTCQIARRSDIFKMMLFLTADNPYRPHATLAVNPLKPTGYVMHQQFNLLKPTGYVMHVQFNVLKPTG